MNKESRSQVEYKICRFHLTECKSSERNGVNVGLVSGYAATWDPDRGNDVIEKGAFQDSLSRHRNENRKVRMHWQHDGLELIGGIDPSRMREDEKGLYFEDGEINLDVGRGKEVYSLMKQGVVTDFSFGYSILDHDYNNKGNRLLKKLELWEVSPVAEPMNPKANVTAVKNYFNNDESETKSSTPYSNLPLADRDHKWEKSAAIQRVRKFTDSEEEPSKTYKKAFFRWDPEKKEDFTAYSFPFADVIDGKLKAVPRAVFAAAEALEGARGGSNVKGQERIDMVRHIEKYYSKMDMDSPFESKDRGESSYFTIQDLKSCPSIRDLEIRLRESGVFSKTASAYIATKLFEGQRDSDNSNMDSEIKANKKNDLSELNQELKTLLQKISKG